MAETSVEHPHGPPNACHSTGYASTFVLSCHFRATDTELSQNLHDIRSTTSESTRKNREPGSRLEPATCPYTSNGPVEELPPRTAEERGNLLQRRVAAGAL